jgi:hypothetical protein
MYSGKNSKFLTSRLVVVLGALLASSSTIASAQTKAAPKVAAPAAKPAVAKPAGAAAKPGGATAAAHGPTTAGHGPTTAGHTGVTTSNPHGATTAGRAPGGPAGARPPVGREPARGLAGRGPEPHGVTHEMRGGHDIARRPDGRPRDVHMANGMNVHHNLNGERRFEREGPDHSRIVAEHGGRGFVEHPYRYGGRDFGRRTYYHDGRVYDRYYGRHYYHGVYVNYYTPAYYYRPAFYGWAYNPWAVAVPYRWGFVGAPWYGYYGFYFTPYPVYANASLWLTDYMIQASLAAAYANAAAAQQQALAAGAPPPGAAPLSPEVKDMISQEVQRQIALANAEAASAQTAPPDPASSSIQRMLTDNVKHVFLVGHSLDVVNAAGGECAVSQGDALQLVGPPPPDSPTASLLVLSTKGGVECQRGDTVSIQIADLQEMQNHMRETIDEGMGQMQKGQANGLPAVPVSAQGEPVKASFMTDAPPPDPNVKTELAQTYNDGAKAEDQVLAGGPSPTPTGGAMPVPAPAPIAAPAPAPTQIELGQTVDQVTAALGPPQKMVDLNTKLIYVYKDMKITFKAGKVADVQ